jgi:hypothetical protein
MPSYKLITGINIQWPWSEHIVSGKKIVETRSYRLPEKLKNIELAIIETPGKHGKKLGGISKARIIGTVVFENSFKYKTKTEWLRDSARHLVEPDDLQFRFSPGKEKWGWVVKSVSRLDKAVPPPAKRGIRLANNCKVPSV